MSLDAFAPDVDLTKELAEESDNTQEAPKVEEEQPAPEVKQEATKEEPKEKLVPYGALHEERQKRKEMQARAEQLERESAERFKKLEERLSKLANPAPKVPEFHEDPANHLKHEVESLKPVTQEVEQLKKTFQEQAAASELARRTTAAESEFMREFPDYLDSVTYLKGIVDKNLQLLGLDDPAQRMAAVNEQAVNLAKSAIQAGKNPAQVAYELAKNYGYKAKAKEPDLEKKIETIERGQKLPSMPSGGKKESPLTTIEAMDDDELNAAIDDPVKWRKLIGALQG